MSSRGFTEYQSREFVRVAQAVAGGCRTAAQIASQLFTFTVQSQWGQRERPYFTHCKLAALRGVQHRNTSRDIIAVLIAQGLIVVSDDRYRSPQAMQAAVAAGDVIAPGYSWSFHKTYYRIDWARVYDLGKTIRDAASRALDEYRREIRAWKKRRADRSARRAQSHRVAVLDQLRAMRAADRAEADRHNPDRQQYGETLGAWMKRISNKG